MNTELQRQRVARFEPQREHYLDARQRTTKPTLAADRRLLTTRSRYVPVAGHAVRAPGGGRSARSALSPHRQRLLDDTQLRDDPGRRRRQRLRARDGRHDWFAAPAGSRVRSVGVWFAIGTILDVTIFTQSWVARFGVDSDAGGLGVVLGFMGSAVALMTGWLLGEYLERLAALQPATTTSPALTEQPTSSTTPETSSRNAASPTPDRAGIRLRRQARIKQRLRHVSRIFPARPDSGAQQQQQHDVRAQRESQPCLASGATRSP